MRSNKHIETFKSALLAKNNMGECPFLVEWFTAKVEELDKLPDEHDRSGIAKGERLPVPKSKYVLALYHITFKKLPLKEFCEVMGVNHGTGRNWRNTDKIFQEIALEFAKEFSYEFLRRYSELIESTHPERFFKASEIVKECRRYPGVTVEQVMLRLDHYSKLKEKEAGPAWDNLSVLVQSNRLLSFILRLSLKNTDADRRKCATTLISQESQAFDAFYKKLREMYKSPDAQAAIDLAEDQAYQSRINYLTILNEFIG
jgi:hypothetical protein